MTREKNRGGRPSGEKTRCGGLWTEARFHSFVKSTLRQATRKWGPIQQCLKDARIRRGWYLCAECKEEIPATILVDRKRKKNAVVDHINPIVPVTGWVSWDDCVERMFSEKENLQCLCLACHKEKCAEEAAERKLHKNNGEANE